MAPDNRVLDLHTIRFLCADHRQLLIEQPAYADGLWSKLITAARQKTTEHKWDVAALIYGNAFETAEILIKQEHTTTTVQCYLRTAIEFTYALRRCSYSANIALLLAAIKAQLAESFYPNRMNLLINTLHTIAFAPLRQATCRLQHSKKIPASCTEPTVH
ncbi:MAG: hypothetical protein KTR20_00630 [Cellvibrionaceae bacterium]|nr:hypothetical protein [Cellvibrionaceae bacterium]